MLTLANRPFLVKGFVVLPDAREIRFARGTHGGIIGPDRETDRRDRRRPNAGTKRRAFRCAGANHGAAPGGWRMPLGQGGGPTEPETVPHRGGLRGCRGKRRRGYR